MATLMEVPEGDSGVASSEATPESTEAGALAMAPTRDTEAIPDQDPETADLDEEEEEDIDESLLERVWGLTEMFPDSLRNTCSSTVGNTFRLLKASYSLTRQVVWIAASSSVILFAPIMFELERLNVEEMMKQDRNRLVLGPGTAMSGTPTTSGLMPPPPPTR